MMLQHLSTLSAIVVSLFAPCPLGHAQVDAKKRSEGDASKAEIVSINTVGPRAKRQSDADIVHYKGHFYVAYAKNTQAHECDRSYDQRIAELVARDLEWKGDSNR